MEMQPLDWAELVDAAFSLHQSELAQKLLTAAYEQANQLVVKDIDQLLDAVRRMVTAAAGRQTLTTRQLRLLFQQ